MTATEVFGDSSSGPHITTTMHFSDTGLRTDITRAIDDEMYALACVYTAGARLAREVGSELCLVWTGPPSHLSQTFERSARDRGMCMIRNHTKPFIRYLRDFQAEGVDEGVGSRWTHQVGHNETSISHSPTNGIRWRLC